MHRSCAQPSPYRQRQSHLLAMSRLHRVRDLDVTTPGLVAFCLKQLADESKCEDLYDHPLGGIFKRPGLPLPSRPSPLMLHGPRRCRKAASAAAGRLQSRATLTLTPEEDEGAARRALRMSRDTGRGNQEISSESHVLSER